MSTSLLREGVHVQIKELSRATGVDVETIRFYEKQGLLPPPARRDNGYRDYAEPHLERLSFIRHCRALDMPLADVARLLSFLDEPEVHCADVNGLVDQQLARVRARLKSMRALEKQLMLLRSQCRETISGQCGILEELVSAAHGEACACHRADSLA
jgi:Cd(II)/Pb(II)-responsive transcriptional regulator